MSSRVQCRDASADREVQIPYFGVQISDFSAASPDGAMASSTRGGTMTHATSERVGPATRKVATSTEIPGFAGEVLAAEHADYDEARTVWNGAVDRFPFLIARCSSAADV